MKHRLTPAELEAMTTHEVAELLTNVVLLLRRMPDIPLRELLALAKAEKEPAQAMTAESEPASNA